MIATPLIHHLKHLRFWNRELCWVALLVGVVLEVLLCPAVALAQPIDLSDTVPAIEWLKFSVPSEQQARFIEQDAAIWTPVLASYPGFESKEVWTNPDRPDELVLVIHWASFEQWQAIPADVLDRTTQQFHQAMGTEYSPESVGFRLAWSSEKP
ncbi:MAG: TIGR03792 family protein [Synechococcales cyanobacterium C42_A2020_086]|jgi:uncharacterized protein (TIGR03792 family)|nr:TIGR03792 family protein [Synechococcales cyanobacterium C42_A2020_086]